MPFWRAIFFPLWHYSLLGKLGEAVQAPALSSQLYRGVLALSLLALNATWHLPDPYWLVSFLTFLPFLPILIPVADATSSHLIHEPVSNHRPVNFIAYVLGGPLFMITVLTTIGFFPSTAVVTADQLWGRDIAYLREAEILGPEEEIIYFYSAGQWAIAEDGQFISNDYVTSYRQDPENGETYVSFAAYEDIEDINVIWASTFWDITLATITTADEEQFELYLSTEYEGDKKLISTMRRIWRTARNSPNSVP